MRFALALLAMTAVAQAGEPWPSFGNPYLHRAGRRSGLPLGLRRLPHAGGTRRAWRGDLSLAGRQPPARRAGYPVAVVLKGQKAMPPFGELLTDEQVAAVVNYIRTHFGNSYVDAPTAADVAAGR